MKQASEELGIKEDVIRRDLGRVLLKLEEMQDEQIKAALAPKEDVITMTDDERADPMELLGVLRESGHEHFNGSIVIPVFNRSGEVVEMYGRKVTPNLREGTPNHLYLPGAHKGVWNEEAVAVSKELILCESLIDALSFWSAGFRNVTASYGVNGFTADHRAAFEKHGTERVYIAYDRDEAGDKAAAALAVELMQMGIECFRVMFPKGMDANEYSLKVQPAAKSFGVLLIGIDTDTG
jgi:DNA primase